MIIFFSLLVALIGLLAYALSTNGKVAEIGRIAFFCGLFVFLLRLEPTTVALLGK